jgi:ABC-type polysaccharide/polyol phosphate export permease
LTTDQRLKNSLKGWYTDRGQVILPSQEKTKYLYGTYTVFPVEMMPEFLQKLAKVLPLYYVNEGLRASMISVDNMAALRYATVRGVFGAVVFVLGIMTTTLSKEVT